VQSRRCSIEAALIIRCLFRAGRGALRCFVLAVEQPKKFRWRRGPRLSERGARPGAVGRRAVLERSGVQRHVRRQALMPAEGRV
jgi:hypothetical protein